MLLAAAAQLDLALGALVLQLRLARGQGLAEAGELAAVAREGVGILGHRQAQRFRGMPVAFRSRSAAIALFAGRSDIQGQALDPVATVGGDRLFYPVAIGLELSLPFLAGPDARGQALALGVELGQALVQQSQLIPREPGFQGFAGDAQPLAGGAELVEADAIVDYRREGGHLGLGLQHGFVRAVQVVEVMDQGFNALLAVEGLQHVLTDEVRQVADGLERDRLVEQFQGLLVVDPEEAPEGGRIGGEGVEDLDPGTRAQAPPQFAYIRAEVREVASDVQRMVADHVEARRLSLLVLHPEHLGQAILLAVSFVLEGGEDDRIAVLIAQGHGLGRHAGLAALGLEVPHDIGAQGPLAGVGTGGLVVGQALGRHQEGRDGVHQGGFARADVAGEQGVLATGGQAPDAAVEGSPVVELEVLESKAGLLVALGEVQEGVAHSSASDAREWPR